MMLPRQLTLILWMSCGSALVLLLPVSSAEFSRIYSSCYGLTFDQCPMKATRTKPSLQACELQANALGGNAFGYMNQSRDNCHVFFCPIGEGNVLQYSLRRVKVGLNLFVESSSYRLPGHTIKEETFKHLDDALQAIIIMSKPAIKIAIPFLGSIISSILDIVTEVLIRSEQSYNNIRANVLRDIREELNNEAVRSMSIRIQSMLWSTKSLLSKIGTSLVKLEDWEIVDGELSLKSNISGHLLNIDDETRSVFQQELICLETIVENARADFMLSRQRYLSLAYYKEYALTHIILLSILHLISGSTALKASYQTELQDIAALHRDYILVAIEEAVWEVEKHREEALHKDLCFAYPWRHYEARHAVPLNQRMQCMRQELYQIYSVDTLDKISNYGNPTSYKDTLEIRNHDQIALLYADPQRPGDDLWMSCDTANLAKCLFSNCPKQGDPFRPNCRQHFICERVVLGIHAVNRLPGEWIHNHDTVMLYTVDEEHNRYYLNASKDGDLTAMSKRAHYNEFALSIPGKNQHGRLVHRDVITLESKETQYVTRHFGKEWFFVDYTLKSGGRIKLKDPEGCDYKYSWIIHRLGAATDKYMYKIPKCPIPGVHVWSTSTRVSSNPVTFYLSAYLIVYVILYHVHI